MAAVGQDVAKRLLGHLEVLYGRDVAEAQAPRFTALLERFAETLGPRPEPFVSADDVLLITYGDQFREPDRRPLETLDDFLADHLYDLISGVHLLPHYPSTSDEGFAVADYDAVAPELGTWRDVLRLSERVDLMLDAVVNHTSAAHPWFQGWARGEPAFADFYISLPPDTDTEAVTRPRTSPVLTPMETADGVEYVWTTFSADQVDLNYANPEVLLAMSEVLLTYVERGARLLRLDAVGFLWKELGTSCIHLPQTHEIVRLWRTMLDAVAPGTLLVTETNVPHDENVAYFGAGDDEAHLVYQFPLPPLTLAAFHLADATVLGDWVATLPDPGPRASFLTFLGCHDGIGLRPAEGLLTPAEIEHLCELARGHGGGVSYRADGEGRMRPYELNTVFFDALNPLDVEEPDEVRIARFLAAHAILLALAGVPLLYVQAVLGSHNWLEGVQRTGRLRSINRQRFERADLDADLARPGSHRRRVLDGLRRLVTARRGESAFHPSGPQRVLETPRQVLGLERTSPDGGRRVLALANVSGRAQRVELPVPEGPDGAYADLLGSGVAHADDDGVLRVTLPGYGVRWLAVLRDGRG